MGVRVRFHRGAWWVFVKHKGRRKSKRVGDEQAARAVARKIRERLALGDLGLFADSSPTFDTYATGWLRDAKSVLKPSTYRFYEFNLRLHVTPVLGPLRVSAITRAHCRSLLVACRQKKLKPASLRGVNRTVSAVLSQAVDDGHLQANPAFRMGKHLRTDGALKNEMQPWTPEEEQTFLRYVEQHAAHWHPFFLCALRTGMRLGELLAVEWRDLDFDARLISVRRAWVGGATTTPKNRKGRKIDMSVKLAETLRALRTAQRKRAWQRNEVPPETVFVMPDLIRLDGEERKHITGGRVDGDNLRRRVFGPLCAKAQVPEIRIHDLRHTFASRLIANGESLAYVRDQLGHSSIQVTVDIYGHLVPGANRAAVDRLDMEHPIGIPGASDGTHGDGDDRGN
jgi:integrase